LGQRWENDNDRDKDNDNDVRAVDETENKDIPMKQFMLASGLALGLGLGARGAANDQVSSAVGDPVNGAPAGGSYAAWQTYRDALLKDDSIVRFYSFAGFELGTGLPSA
jgi:hypothetical protein